MRALDGEKNSCIHSYQKLMMKIKNLGLALWAKAAKIKKYTNRGHFNIIKIYTGHVRMNGTYYS